jgi:hypothetical protein
VQVDHLTNRFNQLIQIQSLEPDLILIKKGLQEVVWFNWASPVSPDTFGKLMNLLEVSDGEKTVYGGVQD